MTTPARFTADEHPRQVLAALLESSDDAIIVTDLEGLVLEWNRGAAQVYGYSTSEILGRSILIIMPADAAEIPAMLKTVRAGRIERRQAVHLRKDGRPADVFFTLAPVRDESEQPIGAMFVARDLTDSTRAAAALQRSELRWRAIVDSAVDGIIVIDATGRIEGFNPSAERLFGFQKAEVVGRNVSMLMPSPHREAHNDYLSSYLTTGTAKVIGIGREVMGLHRDGTTFPIHLSVGEVYAGGERRFTGIVHDLRPRAQIEEQLREQTALARLGEMAAVIAHEVRNPLAGVRGAIQVIGSRLPKESGDAAMVNEIVSRIDGLNELIKDLLLFARPPRPRPTKVDVGVLVSATVQLLRADPVFQGVEVTVEGAAPPLQADAELMKTVFLNLLINAAQAMKGQGVMRVSIAAVGPACEVAFRDSGPGIPPEVRDRIFAPFFTTKARGTGLGLPTARGLVEAHGGGLQVECPAGGGTTVTVRIPL